MSAPDDQVPQWIDRVLARTQDQLRSALDDLVQQVRQQVSAEQAEAARAARTTAESAAAALAAEAIAAERGRAEDRVREAVLAARAEHERDLSTARAELQQARTEALASQRQTDLAASAAVLDAIRALDQPRTLTDVLDVLFSETLRHVPRVALLVVRDGALRGWRWHGFDARAGDARAFATPIDAEGLVNEAARTGETRTGASGTHPGVLAPVNPDRAAVAVPIVIDGRVVAVVYGDDDGDGEREVPSAWPEAVEVLARHAARCCEALTGRRLPDLVRASAAAAHTAQAEEEAAQRYARLLVAEIKLYHEAEVDDGRREGDLLRRLRPPIERAQQLYEERVPAAIRARTRYFQDEIVKTLAGGDPALLGQAT